MLKKTLEMISATLREYGASHVYTMFNGLPPDQRSKETYALIGVESFESSAAFFTYDIIYIPYKADIEIKLTAAEGSSLSELYEYFDEYILPAVMSLTGVKTALKTVSAKYDSNINRLVFTVKFSINGLIRAERSEL